MIVGNTENIRQSEIRSLLAFFVIEGGLIRSHEAPTCLHIDPELITLHIRKGGNIWKDQQPERLQVIGIQEAVIDHFKWHMILNQSMVEPKCMIPGIFLPVHSAIVLIGLLRINHT